MDRDEAMRLLRGGFDGIREWNQRRIEGEAIPDLSGADLSGAVLRDGLGNCSGADLHGAQLAGAKFIEATLAGSSFTRAVLIKADFSGALTYGCDTGADFSGADLSGANFSGADLDYADLGGARLFETNFQGAVLGHFTTMHGANFRGSHLNKTVFANVNLAVVLGLDSVDHVGPSSIGTDTLARSLGMIPEAFLRGCGLSPLEVLWTSLYDPNLTLTPTKLDELQRRVFDAWTKGRSMISGCFFSYSWANRKFVDKLGARLEKEGISVWIDRNKMLAGSLQSQVWRAIQANQVVIIVLSKDSVQSDWVENELDMARSKEKDIGRSVLCPVALDNAWEAKVKAKDEPGDPNRKLWVPLLQNKVMDFSRWKTKAFEEEFGKLLGGLKVNYGPVDPPCRDDAGSGSPPAGGAPGG